MLLTQCRMMFSNSSIIQCCGSAVRDIVVITRSLLRCQMLFVVFVVCVMFQVILAWDRTGVNVKGMTMEGQWNGLANNKQFVCDVLIFDDDVDDAFICSLSQ